MSSNVGLLAEYQSLDIKPSTHIPYETAELLASRLIAEKITRKLYRMLPSNSVFPTLKAFHCLTPRKPRQYEHHVEPKTVQFSIDNSEWERYLRGYAHAKD